MRVLHPLTVDSYCSSLCFPQKLKSVRSYTTCMERVKKQKKPKKKNQFKPKYVSSCIHGHVSDYRLIKR